VPLVPATVVTATASASHFPQASLRLPASPGGVVSTVVMQAPQRLHTPGRSPHTPHTPGVAPVLSAGATPSPSLAPPEGRIQSQFPWSVPQPVEPAVHYAPRGQAHYSPPTYTTVISPAPPPRRE